MTAPRFDSASGEGITNVYNGFGRLTSSSTNMGGVTRTLTYIHDPSGNRIYIVHPDGNYFRTWYDGLNRPFFNLVNDSGGAYLHVLYADHGGPGWAGRSNGNATNFTYDGLQRVATMGHDYLSGDVNWTYARNPANPRRRLTPPAQSPAALRNGPRSRAASPPRSAAVPGAS